MDSAANKRKPPDTGTVLRDYGRGLAGGLLFGLPVLLTMEVWWQGFLLPPIQLVGFLAVHYLLLLGLVWVAGFKAADELSLRDIAFEAVETLGLAVFLSAALLLIFGLLAFDASAVDAVGMVVMEAIPVSVGIAIATSQLRAPTPKGAEDQEEDADENGREQVEATTAGQYVLVAGGASYMAYNFAAIEEMTAIAFSMNWMHQLVLVALSLVVTFGLVFALQFKGGTRKADGSLLEQPLVETVVSYALSLAISLALLFFFGAVAPGDSLLSIVDHVLVLGFPASVGAAAGRLLV